MKRILFIRSSLFAGNSASNQLGDEFVQQLVERNPGSTVTTLDLANAPLPHLDADEFSSWQVDETERSDTQRTLAGVSDRLIDQLFAHDTLVFAIPMYNMGIPSTLKAWIDRVVRAGKTFRYTSEGPEGLVEDTDAYLLFTRGGNYKDTPLDTQTSYMKGVLGLMGIHNTETVFAEGLARSDQRESALEDARRLISQLAQAATPEVRYAIA